MLARTDLPDDLAYRLAKALQGAESSLCKKLPQACETTAANTVAAAPRVADALRRQARIDVVVDEGPVLSSEAYRTTLRGVATDGRFGFRRRHSHELVDVGPCLVAHPLLD